MRRHFLALLSGALVLVLSIGVGVSIAGTTQASATEPAVGGTDNLSHPLGDKQEALKQVALEKVAKGEIPKGTKVGQVAKGQYVELAREGEDSILTVLGEFGTSINPVTGGTPGPVHNQIPQPNRSVDNTTIWAPDFNQAYYTDLLFDDASGENSMRNFYKEQSSNRYTVNGEVTDWVKVPFNEARYGTNLCGSNVCSTVWAFVNSSVDAWAATLSPADLNAKLAKYDVWDRYDYDGDGNFNEPDGYIDHFQSIHAGVGEETGGGAQGPDAIWSHRWYAYFSANGPDGVGPAQLRRRAHWQLELLGRRLHDRAGERRRRRVLARVRPRSRAPGRVRHVGQHRRRRERHGLLDADVAGLVRQQRRGRRGDRQPAVPHERVGQAPAGLARLRAAPTG